jgi:hypothetical protein
MNIRFTCHPPPLGDKAHRVWIWYWWSELSVISFFFGAMQRGWLKMCGVAVQLSDFLDHWDSRVSNDKHPPFPSR